MTAADEIVLVTDEGVRTCTSIEQAAHVLVSLYDRGQDLGKHVEVLTPGLPGATQQAILACARDVLLAGR